MVAYWFYFLYSYFFLYQKQRWNIFWYIFIFKYWYLFKNNINRIEKQKILSKSLIRDSYFYIIQLNKINMIILTIMNQLKRRMLKWWTLFMKMTKMKIHFMKNIDFSKHLIFVVISKLIWNINHLIRVFYIDIKKRKFYLQVNYL